jgi:hypothetical protein
MNDGSFLVSDGYCNSRVLRYKPDGAFVARAFEYAVHKTLTDLLLLSSSSVRLLLAGGIYE